MSKQWPLVTWTDGWQVWLRPTMRYCRPSAGPGREGRGCGEGGYGRSLMSCNARSTELASMTAMSALPSV